MALEAYDNGVQILESTDVCNIKPAKTKDGTYRIDL